MRSTPKNLMEKSSVLFGMSKSMAITGLLQSYCQCQMMQFSRTEHTFILSQVKYMTYELTKKEYNKEAWKTYVNHTPPGVFTKCPVLPNIGNHWRHFL